MAFGLPIYVPEERGYRHVNENGGPYDRYIEGLFNATAKHTGHERIHERVEAALLKTRGGKETDLGWRVGEQQIDAYADALDLPTDKRDALVKTLAGKASPLRPRRGD